MYGDRIRSKVLMALGTSCSSQTTVPGTHGAHDSIGNTSSSRCLKHWSNLSRRPTTSLFGAVASTTNLRMDRLADGATPIPSLENQSNRMLTTRMESRKERIARFERRLRLCYRRRRSLGKSQASSRRKAPSSCAYLAFPRTATEGRRLEVHYRIHLAGDAFRQPAAAISLAKLAHNVKPARKQTYDVTGI